MDFEPLEALLGSARSDAAPAARRAGRLLDFGAFRAEAAAWRAAFEAQPGSRFALYFEDSVRFAAALFGLWHAGGTAYLPGDSLPATLDRLAAHVDGFAGDVPADRAPVRPAEVGGAAASGPWPPLDRRARQLVIFTSGSTGEPAAIEKQLGQLFAEVEALQQAFGARAEGTQTLATVSHQHIYGLLFRVLWPLAAGRVFQAERLAYVEDVPPLLGRFGAALLIASPAHLKRLLAVEIGPALKAVFSSGGPLPDAAVPDCVARLGAAPIEVYGSSETGGVAWRQRNPAASPAWRALPGVQWRLEGETLEIRSPHLDHEGWAATADRAEPCHEAGPDQFRLLGRADRVLKIEEKRISLAAVEQQLLASGWLQELRVLAASGASGESGGREQLVVVAVPNEAGWAVHDELGKAGFAARLRGLLLQGLDAVSAPRRWRFVSALPSNAQGKSTAEALRALFDPRRPQPRVLSATPTAAMLRIAVDAALPQFDGHFPAHPVLPGVAQLEWAILLGRELFAGLPPRFLGLEGLKFQQVIAPGTVLTLSLEFKPETGRLAFHYSSARGPHASGRVLFGAEA